MQTSQVQYSTALDEILISPVLDLRAYDRVNLGFTRTNTNAGTTSRLRFSTNGGLSWITRHACTTDNSGFALFDLSEQLAGQSAARLSFQFDSEFPVSGSWQLDDLFLNGRPAPPIATAPLPAQPPLPIPSFVTDVGCTWSQFLPIEGSSLQLRVDRNGDGVYAGELDNWMDLPDQPDGTLLQTLHTIALNNNGFHAFEFRARCVDGTYGYSGQTGTPGISDDWAVFTAVPPMVPIASDPLPAQPAEVWFETIGTVGCTWTQSSGINGDSLQFRVDLNGDGDYLDGVNEGWIPLAAQPSAEVLTVQQGVSFLSNGQFAFEFRAKSLAGFWGYSGNAGIEGIEDDW
ncbi:MAG: hypothetical protein KDC10_16685, partial [Calditrichaeota bacterium]|nr:hypothetical protein [Calditrichota bacterium]